MLYSCCIHIRILVRAVDLYSHDFKKQVGEQKKLQEEEEKVVSNRRPREKAPGHSQKSDENELE